MEIIRSAEEMKRIAAEWKSSGKRVGLVPTMGFLHEGHLSLIRQSVKDNDETVVSVFVNPIQFGKNEDFGSYPRDMEHDAALCSTAGASVVFAPGAEDMYPDGFCSRINVDGPSEGLCGARRPGHFSGVCTVVMKLFCIATPDRAYFGQKDAQQLAVIRRMVKDFNLSVKITGMPIVREADGLALSSRNTYLNAEERRAALCLHRALGRVAELYADGERDCAALKSAAQDVISAEPLAKADYIEIVDAETMQPVPTAEGTSMCALAVYIGRTRLIDNTLLG